MYGKRFMVTALVLGLTGCEILDNDLEDTGKVQNQDSVYLEDVAALFSELPLSVSQMEEVQDAVKASAGNGYDQEYTMQDLFLDPGRGVGDPQTRAVRTYACPLRELLHRHVKSKTGTRTRQGEVLEEDVVYDEAYLEALMSSGYQIYWPYSETWDGISLPVITFDPENESDTNYGYELRRSGEEWTAVKVLVDEQLARKKPVWVINRNSDARHKTTEVLRREHPEWEEGGALVIRPVKSAPLAKGPSATVNSRSLILKNLTMYRNYDCWFAGASEFFLKFAGLEDFTAVTEAELKLYSPYVTDLMVVVRRDQVGVQLDLNTVLLSAYSPQLEECALLIHEDDGGTKKTWKCQALVRIESKSFGIEVDLPFSSYDDIVWRGRLDQRYLVAHNAEKARFGDLGLTFEIEER